MLTAINPLNARRELRILVNGFHRLYNALFCLEVGSQRCSLMFSNDEVKAQFADCDTFSNFLKVYVAKRLEPKYEKVFLDYMRIDTMVNRLKGQKKLHLDYEAVHVGWVRTFLIPAEFNENDEPTHILIAIAPIAEEISWRNSMLRMSEIDGMTGLYNRASGVNLVRSSMEAREKGVFMYVDCDKFKLINDDCGHHVGDKVLVEFAHILQRCFPECILIRLGGDEFGVYFKGHYTFDELRQAVQPMFEQVAAIDLPELQKTGMKCAVSAGAASYMGDPDASVEDLLRLADKRLYESKHHPGNYLTYIDSNQSTPWYMALDL